MNDSPKRKYTSKPTSWKDIARELYNSLSTIVDDVHYGHLDSEGQVIGSERLRRAKNAVSRYGYHRYVKNKKELSNVQS